ncbi:MAG: hypothetical protein WCH75_18965 [Candidatus Binatia bacterium]
MIPCYVGGRGKSARASTQDFKVAVFELLESTGLGYDTRYRYYRQQYPDMSQEQFARMVCDPIEAYDKDWPDYRTRHRGSMSEDALLTAFVLEKDQAFRDEARAAIICYNEAGLGTGINSMRLLADGKPLIGFFLRDPTRRPVNVQNILQLEFLYPSLVTLVPYDDLKEVAQSLSQWLSNLRR